MYDLLLSTHSYLRWIVVALAVFVIAKAVLGLLNKSEFSNADSKTGLFFMISCDIQLLVGLLLYFWASPITTGALANFGAAMKIPETRYWAVEHITAMVIAWLLVHIGRAKSKRGTDSAKHKSALIFYGIAILIVVVTIPWASRPYLR
jgi:hypothetical protein